MHSEGEGREVSGLVERGEEGRVWRWHVRPERETHDPGSPLYFSRRSVRGRAGSKATFNTRAARRVNSSRWEDMVYSRSNCQLIPPEGYAANYNQGCIQSGHWVAVVSGARREGEGGEGGEVWSLPEPPRGSPTQCCQSSTLLSPHSAASSWTTHTIFTYSFWNTCHLAWRSSGSMQTACGRPWACLVRALWVVGVESCQMYGRAHQVTLGDRSKAPPT